MPLIAPSVDVLPPPVVGVHRYRGQPCASRFVRGGGRARVPLLLIGGAFQRKEHWGAFERAFLARMDVLTVDPPGWGAGAVLPPEHGADFLARAVCHMLNEAGIARVHVLGGSYGTAIAYRLAQLFPDRVERMVLVGTMTAIPEHAEHALRRGLDLLEARRMQEFARATVGVLMNEERLPLIARGAAVRRFLMRRLSTLPYEEGEQTRANTRRLLLHRMVDATAPPRPPVLVVTGEHDAFTTPELCREMARACGDSWFAEVADADHMVHLERTAELAALAGRFLLGDAPLSAELPFCRLVERISEPAAEGSALRR
ncbi:alpha/beta hydrolase [Streptomyces sp. DSM 44917]|uniref:Alpha/beta hydrolase n=1 Tax=Streptomyces boetiae TaxID=3075541 RepID=A0ABU2LDC9_9ACTN|nr:alpha/beta hydrolase [Streptomyces sp. DSM 44917]MDT0309589.1 alpha/beta hydrolase [Streptomyces sp. DSM 44917]